MMIAILNQMMIVNTLFLLLLPIVTILAGSVQQQQGNENFSIRSYFKALDGAQPPVSSHPSPTIHNITPLKEMNLVKTTGEMNGAAMTQKRAKRDWEYSTSDDDDDAAGISSDFFNFDDDDLLMFNHSSVETDLWGGEQEPSSPFLFAPPQTKDDDNKQPNMPLLRTMPISINYNDDSQPPPAAAAADVAPSSSSAHGGDSGFGYGHIYPPASPPFSIEGFNEATDSVSRPWAPAAADNVQKASSGALPQSLSHYGGYGGYGGAVTPTASAAEDASSSSSSSNWAKLQISPNVVGSVPYGNFRINVYEHSANQRNAIGNENSASVITADGANSSGNKNHHLKKFYYAPISFLDHASAVSYLNNVTQQAEMRFRIELWNDAIQKEVVDWIKREIDSTVKDSFIQVIPFEKLILTTSSAVATNQQKYQLTKAWTPYQLQKDVRFKLICYELSDCDHLAQQMRHNADQFSHFRLLFSLSSERAQMRQTLMRVKNVVKGQMASTLLQRLPNAESALLTAKDEKRLLTESTTNILIDTFDDSDDVISPNSEAQIYQLLRDNLLAPSRTIIKEQSDTMWESVFWDDDNYRPDKTTKTWNEIYNKLDTKNRKKLVSSFQNADKFAGGGSVGNLFLNFKLNINGASTNHGGSTDESLDKLFKESKETVEWSGEKFVPKPLALSRVNLVKLRDTQTFKDRTVRVSYSKAVLAVTINIAQHTNRTSSNRLVELQQGMKNLQTALTNQIKGLLRRIEVLEKPMDGPKPTSCNGLKQLGHLKNGFYTVKPYYNEKRLRTIYCDFTKANLDYETAIGYNDVKTTDGGVYFYVTRNSNFASVYSIITYDVAHLNIGGAMNLETGAFIAPTNGRYFFSFIAHSWGDGSVLVYLRRSGLNVGSSFAPSKQYNLPISVTLNLKRGEQVDVVLNGSLWDSSYYHTKFSGILLEEDLEF